MSKQCRVGKFASGLEECLEKGGVISAREFLEENEIPRGGGGGHYTALRKVIGAYEEAGAILFLCELLPRQDLPPALQENTIHALECIMGRANPANLREFLEASKMELPQRTHEKNRKAILSAADEGANEAQKAIIAELYAPGTPDRTLRVVLEVLEKHPATLVEAYKHFKGSDDSGKFQAVSLSIGNVLQKCVENNNPVPLARALRVRGFPPEIEAKIEGSMELILGKAAAIKEETLAGKWCSDCLRGLLEAGVPEKLKGKLEEAGNNLISVFMKAENRAKYLPTLLLIVGVGESAPESMRASAERGCLQVIRETRAPNNLGHIYQWIKDNKFIPGSVKGAMLDKMSEACRIGKIPGQLRDSRAPTPVSAVRLQKA